MRSPDHADVIRDRVVRWHKGGLNSRTDSDSKTTGYGDHRLMRHETMHLHADVASGKIVFVIPRDRNAISCDPKVVDRVRRNQIRIAESGGLLQIVQTADSGIEDIPGKLIRRGLLKAGNHVTSEEAVFIADLIINAADGLIFVGLRYGTKRHLPAWSGSNRQLLHDLQRQWTELTHRHLVVRIRRVGEGITRLSKVATAEVSSEHSCC